MARARTKTAERSIADAVQRMTPAQRQARFEQIRRIVARSGGILLDSALTQELVLLGELLGVPVVWERVQLPTYGASRRGGRSKRQAPPP